MNKILFASAAATVALAIGFGAVSDANVGSVVFILLLSVVHDELYLTLIIIYILYIARKYHTECHYGKPPKYCDKSFVPV